MFKFKSDGFNSCPTVSALPLAASSKISSLSGANSEPARTTKSPKKVGVGEMNWVGSMGWVSQTPCRSGTLMVKPGKPGALVGALAADSAFSSSAAFNSRPPTYFSPLAIKTSLPLALSV